MPSRRGYPAVLAAAGLAGCVGDPPGSANGSPTDTDTTTPGTPSRPGATVEAAAVQYAYRHVENVDWNAIRPADGQFVLVAVDAGGAEPVPDRGVFSLVAGDEAHDPADTEGSCPVDLDVPGELYAPGRANADPREWLVFDVPARLDAAPSLRPGRDTGSREWDLDAERATAPPPARDWAASAPETVAPGETFDSTVSAENVGDGPGTFRGAVNFSHPICRPEGFDVALGPGESGEATVPASSEEADPGTELGYGVRTPAGESTVTVTVAPEPGSAGGRS
jgi:hypothetical protein